MFLSNSEASGLVKMSNARCLAEFQFIPKLTNLILVQRIHLRDLYFSLIQQSSHD